MLFFFVAPTLAFASTPLVNEPPGTIITFSSKQWMVLSHMPDGNTYIILNSNDGSRAFDPNNTQVFNPTDSNNIGWYLNNTFYNSLSQKDLIKTHSWERKFENGTGGQANVNAKIGLLSHGEYQTYRGNPLPQSGSGYWWWLRTPHSGNSTSVWVVNTSGNLYNAYAFNSSGGVRPALYLESGILVSGSKEVIGTGEPDPPPVAPTGLGVSNITQTSATVSWNAVTGSTEYKVYLNGTISSTTSSTNGTLNGLSPDTQYTVEVSAVGPGGESVKASKVFSTLAHVPPDQPTGLIVSDVTQNNAVINWNSVSGATEYKIYLNDNLITTTIATNGTLSGLEPSTQYLVEVSATGPGGESPRASATFETLDIEPPGQATLNASVSGGSAKLSWDAAGYIEKWELYTVDNGEYTLIEEFPGSTKSATLEMPNGDYSYVVRAYNSSGYGDYSATESFSINKLLYHDILDIFKIVGLFIKELWFLLALSLALIVLPRIIQIIKNTVAKRKQTI